MFRLYTCERGELGKDRLSGCWTYTRWAALGQEQNVLGKKKEWWHYDSVIKASTETARVHCVPVHNATHREESETGESEGGICPWREG